MYVSSSVIDLRSKKKCLLKICGQQEAKIESLNTCVLEVCLLDNSAREN